MNKHLVVFVSLVLGLISVAWAQIYLPAESFEAVWSGTPAAPSGWTQVQVQAGTGSSGSDIAWERSVYSGSWLPAGNGTRPTSVPNGTAVAHYNDYNAKSGQIDRLYYNSGIDLTGSTYPSASFWYFYNSGAAALRVVGSNDGGATWNLLGGTIVPTGSTWTEINVSIPAEYKVANFMVGFQVTAAWGGHDLWLDSFTVKEGPIPLSGIKTIDPGGSGPNNFTTFTAAINALYTNGIGSGGVTFNVKDGSVFVEECPVINTTGTAANPIIFQRDNSGSTRPVIKPTTSTAGISIQGGDYFTIDGIDIMINSGSSVYYGYYLRAYSATDGAQHNTIKNSKITLNKSNSSSRGIYQFYNYSPSTTAGANSYNIYENIYVENSISGIYLNGNTTTTYYDQYNEVRGCTIGSESADNMGGLSSCYGIYGSYQNSFNIYNNTVRNITTTSYYDVYGIYVTSGYSCDIYRNKLYSLKCNYNGSSYRVFGIYVSLSSSVGNTARVYNNMVWDLTHGYVGTSSSNIVIYGIWLGGNTSSNTYSIDFNSVRVTGPLTAHSVGVFFNQNGAVNQFRNNVVANLTPGQASSKHYCVQFALTPIGTTGSVSNHNVLYIENTGNGYPVKSFISDYATVAAWNGASGQDGNSKISNPQFSTTPLYVSTIVATPVESAGSLTGITWVTDDIDGSRTLRNDPPDIGADEGDFIQEVECEVPDAQPTALVLVPATTSIGGSFTASDAEAYLVVRHTDAAHNATPVDGTWYTPGVSIGNGTVVAAGASSVFTASGLASNSPYNFTIYAYNSNGLNAPKYLVAGPLTGSMTTLPGVPDNPVTFLATPVSPYEIGFTASANVAGNNIMVAWSGSSTFGVPLVTGYQQGDSIIGGGTVWYMGPVAGLPSHTGLSEGTPYYYKAWSYITADRATYYVFSSGVTATATTPATPLNVPVFQDFEVITTAGEFPTGWTRAGTRWTSRTAVLSGSGYSVNAYSGTDYLTCQYSSSTSDWMFSRGVNLDASKYYDIGAMYATDGLSGWTSLKMYIGTTASGAGMTTELASVLGPINTAYAPLAKTAWQPPATGVYFIGWQVIATINPWYLCLEDFSVTETPSDPQFGIDPAGKNFGNVFVGTMVYQTFTVTNTGGGELGIDSISKTAGDVDYFTIANNSYTDPLGTGEFFTFDVQFNPTAETGYSVTVTVVDDLTKQPHDIMISGTGYDPSISSFPWIVDFTGTAAGAIPADWSRTHTNWGANLTNYAGGSSPEMRFNWQPSGTGTYRVITPPINAGAKGDYVLSFKHYIDYYSTPATYKVQSSQNLTDWADEWTLLDPASNVGPATVQIDLDKTGIFYLAWVYDGATANTDYWYIDDISLGMAPITVPGPESVEGGDIPPELLGPDTGNPASIYTVTATGIHDVIVNNPGWGLDWYCWIRVGGILYAGGNPIPAATATWTFSGIDFDAKGDAVVIVNDNQTLPVELSSFTATLTADMYVRIAWVSQSETNHLGYNLLRGEENTAAQALQINPAIITSDQGIANGTQISYNFTDAEVDGNVTYYYWLESVDLAGISVIHGPVSVTVNNDPDDPGTPELPTVTKLLTAFPNPFNPSTSIRYQLKESAPVKIEIFNIKGQLIRVFEEGHVNPGYHQISWDGRDAYGRPAASGVYLYRMSSGKYTSSKRMVLAK